MSISSKIVFDTYFVVRDVHVGVHSSEGEALEGMSLKMFLNLMRTHDRELPWHNTLGFFCWGRSLKNINKYILN